MTTRDGVVLKKAPYGGIDLEVKNSGGLQAGNLIGIQPLRLNETGVVLGPQVTATGAPINDKLGLVTLMGTKSYLYLQINETEENENLHAVILILIMPAVSFGVVLMPPIASTSKKTASYARHEPLNS